MSNEEIVSNDVDANEIIHQQEFGVQLREARERQGHTIHDISEQLHLSEEIVKALESSSTESLPAPTFTQGYLRAYARLLKLSEEDILDAYNQNIPDKEAPLVPNYGMPIQVVDSSSGSRSLIIVLLVCFIALLAYFFVGSEVSLDSQNGNAVEEQIEEVPVPEESLMQDSEDVDSSEINDKNTNQNHARIDESATESTDSQLNIQQPVEQPAEKPAPSIAPVTNTERAVKAETPEEPEQQLVIEGDDALELVAESASWAEVQDVNGHRLIFELLSKDQVYQVKGMAPFRVFLGNAPAIKILINNHEVDITSYIRKNNIANISIEDNGVVNGARRDRISFNSNDESDQQESSSVNEIDDDL